MKHIKKLIALSLFALTIVLTLNVKTFTKAYVPSNGDQINVVFSDGDIPVSDVSLFDDITLTGNVNASNNMAVPGDSFENTTKDALKAVSETLDPETFVFEADGWAYTFTGWHIQGTTDFLPAQTVYQPGDLILESELIKYVSVVDGVNTIKLEAVWGKCYFIKNPYTKMLFKYDSVKGYIVDEEASMLASGQSEPLSKDTNTGKRPNDAYATINGLYATFRKLVYTDKTMDMFDAYHTVVMLCGNLIYAKDMDKVDSVNYGQSATNNAQATISATYKSLQDKADKSNYDYVYKAYKYTNNMYGNFRFDNVNLLLIDKGIFGTQMRSQEFQLNKYSSSHFKYFELTHRYNLNESRSQSIGTFRPSNTDLVVVNGGSLASMQTTYGSAINEPSKTIKWFVGRNAYISGAIHCGTTVAYEQNVQVINTNFELNITGGRVGSVYGASRGVNTTSKGERTINIIGSGNTTKGEYDPQVNNVFGGAEQCKFYGNTHVTLLNSHLVTNVYGGGDAYTATTYGNITVDVINSTIKGDLYGGGKNANSEIDKNTGKGGDVIINIDNSSINGNIFGSGMGMTQTLIITDNYQYILADTKWYDTSVHPNGYYPEGWKYPLGYNTSGEIDVNAHGYFPVYQEDSGDFLVGAYKQLTWAEANRDQLIVKVHSIYAYLSLATVENVDIKINDSIIGTKTNGKGNVYGGGSIAQVLGDTKITISGNSEIYGSVYGGGDGVSIPEKVTVYKVQDKDTYVAPKYSVTITDGLIVATTVNQSPNYTSSKYGDFTWSNDLSLLDKTTDKGIDFEKKLLYSPNTIGLGKVKGNTTVNINGGKVHKDVYGGGNKGQVDGNTTVNISGDVDITTVYAGCNQADVAGSSTLNINASEKFTITNAFGGNNASGSIGRVFVNVGSGSITNLYGGGNKANDTFDTDTTITGGSITNVFGGGKNASVGNITLSTTGATINTIFGGGDQADVLGNINLEIGDTSITNLYGGNNQTGSISGKVSVSVNNPKLITNLYGGGNLAGNEYDVDVTVTNGHITNLFGGGKKASVGSIKLLLLDGSATNVYGGGDEGATLGNITVDSSIDVETLYGGANKANVDGAIEVYIKDGAYSNIFGGNNESGAISGNVNLVFTGGSTTYLYGGGNKASDDINVTITFDNASATYLYGGGKQASVGSINISLNSGSVAHLFGGGDEGDTLGDINISSNINIDTAFGGANNADVTGSITFIVNNGEFSEIYGGNNVGGVITGDILLTLNNVDASVIYGGGCDASGEYLTTINLNSGSIGTMYGGGKNASVGSVKINVYDGDISSLYGGGFKGHVTGLVDLDITGGTFDKNVYGGGYAGTVGSTDVSVTDKTSNKIITINGSLFGGGEGETASVYTSTNVLVDLALDLNVTETTKYTNDISGISEVKYQITSVNYSKIQGNIYGGGDLGQVGSGDIDSVNNIATINKVATTNVTLTNGYVGGSIFAGGSGVPGANVRYALTMGTVFGQTSVTVNGGLVLGSVYGGGTQSRVYEDSSSDDYVATVNITELTEEIVINGSVFGGGERGNSATMNASVPTTIGDVLVSITGKAERGSQIYFVNGGVYGDGNLCLVRGNRVIEITNFNTTDDTLKTFFSLQRANTVRVTNSLFVLLGAIDLVEEGDETVYSINRIGKIEMYNGSTIKLDQIVKYLGAIQSDRETDRLFIDSANKSDSSTFTARATTLVYQPLTEDEINAYRADLSTPKNVICVANGLFLEVVDETTGDYGPVIGLFTLELLRKVTGEGGGFVYASHTTSTGDFICETLMFDGKDKYMPVMDNYGGVSASNGEQHYWFMQGDYINYIVNIDGYIGSEVTAYESISIIPEHEDLVYYSLKEIIPSDVLTNAISGSSKKYDLVAKNSDLTDQEIAIELKLNGSSWFLVHDAFGFGLKVGESTIRGYHDGSADELTRVKDNILAKDVKISGEEATKFKIILHKSTGVNAELSDLDIDFNIQLFTKGDGEVYNEYTGTNKLNFSLRMRILRLVPVQQMYSGAGKLYDSLLYTDPVSITRGSSMTIEFQTKYIPAAFPSNPNKFEWYIKTETYAYFMDKLGNYMTLDVIGDVVNISPTLTRDKDDSERVLVEFENGEYFYNQNGEKIVLKQHTTAHKSYLPVGTKITLIDLSIDSIPGYYHYEVTDEEISSINLMDFMYMGTNKEINDTNKPMFVQLYESGQALRITERLIFMFDFEDAKIDSNIYIGNVALEHSYGNNVESNDIMDYVNSKVEGDEVSYIRAYPSSFEYKVNGDKSVTGVDDFEADFENDTYPDDSSALINVTIVENKEWTNTLLANGKLGIMFEAPNGYKLPDGIEFVYNGVTYYPMNKNSYVVIPVNKFGNYQIEVKNLLGTIKTTTMAEFIATLVYLPEYQHYNEEHLQTDPVVDNTVDCEITIVEEGSMQVSSVTNVVNIGSELSFYLQLQNTPSTLCTVSLLGEDGKEMIIGRVNGSGTYSYTLNENLNVSPGVYKLIVRNGNLEEVVTVIVKR